MKWVAVLGLVAGLFSGMESLTAKVMVVLGLAAAIVAFHKQVVAPILKGVLTAVKEVRGMVETVDTVPGSLDEINARLGRGEDRFARIEEEQARVNGALEVLASEERKWIERRLYAEVPERREWPMDRRTTDPSDVDGASESP